MRKWLGLLFVILLIACDREGETLTPTAVSDVSTLEATRMVEVAVETTEPPTNTPNPVTAPTETATPRPTAIRTLTPAPTLEFVPPTWPPLPPVTEEAGDSAELSRLRVWTDVEAAELVSRMTDYAERIKADWSLYDLYGDMGRRETMESGREFVLRFPNSPYRTEVEWQMVDASMYYPVGDLNELMAKLIEADLNGDVVTLEALDSYLRQRGLLVNLQSSVPNLLGDGREIPLFLVERQTGHIDGGILMAIWQDTEGKFIVTPILSQWAAFNRFSGGISNFEARHITGGSQPELLVEAWGHSGSMRGISLHMFRWDGGKFVELAGTPFHFDGGPFSDQWGFVEGDDPSRLEVVSGYDNTTKIYEWTGESYEVVELIEGNVPPDPIVMYFPPEWMYREIRQGNYTGVITYLEEALQSPVSNSNLSELQNHRIMQFFLGINYVYLDNGEMARSVFSALRDETSPPELIGFSQAAGAFLVHYDGLESAYGACSAAYDLLLETELGLSGTTSLCDFDKLFVEKLKEYDGKGSLFDYLEAVELIHSQQIDLDLDGHLDWILVFPHPTLFPRGEVGIWAVLLTDIGTEVVKLPTYSGIEEDVEELAVESYSFVPFDAPLTAILSTNGFYLIQLIEGEEQWGAKLLLSNSSALDYDLYMVENRFQMDIFFDAATTYGGFDRITYQWDAEMEEFVEVERHAPNSLGVPFNEALDSVEGLIFEEGDFTAAIPILTIIAEEFDPTGEFSWPVSLPKTLYLLGLAHELAGNEGEAVAAYWRVWHDFPADPYALMGAAKLEEK